MVFIYVSVVCVAFLVTWNETQVGPCDIAVVSSALPIEVTCLYLSVVCVAYLRT